MQKYNKNLLITLKEERERIRGIQGTPVINELTRDEIVVMLKPDHSGLSLA